MKQQFLEILDRYIAQGNWDEKQLCKKIRSEVEKIEEWIPVTERLPEEADDILMKGIFWSQAIGRYHKGEGFVQPSQIGWYKCENVTHWMPLPNPPTI